MSVGYKLKNAMSHVMNIQVYCKDGLYSSAICSTYWCVWCEDKREVEELVPQVLWDVRQCCVQDNTYSSFRWTWCLQHHEGL